MQSLATSGRLAWLQQPHLELAAEASLGVDVVDHVISLASTNVVLWVAGAALGEPLEGWEATDAKLASLLLVRISVDLGNQDTVTGIDKKSGDGSGGEALGARQGRGGGLLLPALVHCANLFVLWGKRLAVATPLFVSCARARLVCCERRCLTFSVPWHTRRAWHASAGTYRSIEFYQSGL